jgi:hypothetical protein
MAPNASPLARAATANAEGGSALDQLELRIGEERAIHLAPNVDWAVQVGGMASAVQVRKLWAADPYPEDDGEDEPSRAASDTVFMVRALAPGTATLHFSAGEAGREDRDVRVDVRM